MMRFAGKRLRFIAVVTAFAVIGACAWYAAANAEVVEHWSIYASSHGRSYTRFLGPFPSAHTCNVEAREIVRAGGHAYCASETVLSFDRTGEQNLFWEFLSVANPWSRVCGGRYAKAT
jgi:hypothetical protein